MKTREEQAKIIAGSLFVSLFFLWGGCYNTSPIFVAALLQAFGWSHARVSLIPGAMALAVGGTGIITGWLLDRLEARLVMGVGAVLVGASLIAASRATTFSGLLAANVAIGIGLGASAWLPSTVVIINWFGDRRGAALGLATAGMESGGMMLTFVAGYIISEYGWKLAYLAISVPILILVLPLLITVVRTRPPESIDSTAAGTFIELPGYDVAEALRTRAFWMLAIANLASGIAVVGVFVHIVAYLMNLGYSMRFTTTVVGVALGLFALGKPTMGALADRIGGRNALGIDLLLISGSSILLLRAKHEWVIVAYLAIFGVSGAAPAALVPLVLSETLGLKRLGTLYGFLQIAITLGLFIGPVVVGRLFDLTHSYTAGFEFAAVIAAIGSAAAFLCTAPAPVTLAAAIAQPQKSTRF
jgi:MFS family permease